MQSESKGHVLARDTAVETHEDGSTSGEKDAPRDKASAAEKNCHKEEKESGKDSAKGEVVLAEAGTSYIK